MPARFIATLVALAGMLTLSSCFLDRAGLGGSDASAPDDAGGMDGGGADIDAALDGRVPPVDAFREDASIACVPADARCEGDDRVTCVGGMLRTDPCSATQHCDDGGGTPVCVDDVCVPDATSCSPDGTEAVSCNSLGTMESRDACSRGCDAGACRPQTACSIAVLATMSSGTMRVDLCGAGADLTHTSACPYADQGTLGEDVIIRLEVDRARNIRIQARQAGGGATIDPTVYLRSACDVMASELWCHEDTSGQDEDFTERLEPGDYFLVIDRHERTGTACGQLDVTITPM